MTTRKPLLHIAGIKLRLNSHAILKGVELSVHAKETMVVFGQSGSGKSTLLRLILGILKADAGSIRFEDKEITKLRRLELDRVRMRMGMVYQYSALLSSMTVRENIGLPLRELSNLTKQEIEKIVDEKLDLVGLHGIKDKLPDELSGGMRKRVGLARALVLQPTLILFDEPSSGLDPINSALIDDLIVSLREKQGVTSIVVTHAMESAFRIATRMAMLHDGKIIEEGTPELFRRSKKPVVSSFLSAYPSKTSSKESKHANP